MCGLCLLGTDQLRLYKRVCTRCTHLITLSRLWTNSRQSSKDRSRKFDGRSQSRFSSGCERVHFELLVSSILRIFTLLLSCFNSSCSQVLFDMMAGDDDVNQEAGENQIEIANFDFEQWVKDSGLTRKCTALLREEDLSKQVVLCMLTDTDIRGLGLSLGQTKLLQVAILALHCQQSVCKVSLKNWNNRERWNMTGGATWSTPYTPLYLVNIVYQFDWYLLKTLGEITVVANCRRKEERTYPDDIARLWHRYLHF